MVLGIHIISKALSDQGITHAFGIVGIPIIELGSALQTSNINFYGFRNEQSASYAAGAIGYLTGRPGLSVCVAGPGFIHALAGIANAWANCWPMLLISASNDLGQDGKGGFQECEQISLTRPYVKFSYKITDPYRIPYFVEKAVKISMSGRPGPVYLELPGDVLMAKVEEENVKFYPKVENIPRCLALPEDIAGAVALLKSSQRPLVIIGKGAAYSRAEQQLLEFITLTNIPFIQTPMAKGVINDDHPLCVNTARSSALKLADTVLLVGARLNWILHFGAAPRFQKGVKIIQIDICPEEFDTNVKGSINLLGDCQCIVKNINEHIKKNSFSDRRQILSDWMSTLKQSIIKNTQSQEEMMLSKELPLSFYSALYIIKKNLPKDFVYIGEGSNTMDIGRTVINHEGPRAKLDAGTFGTMGVGMPFSIAAKIVYPTRPVVAIVGDSAFGFSGMEIETAIRYKLPYVIIILNNNGLFFGGASEEPEEDANALSIPPTTLTFQAHYEKMADAFGGKGYFAKTHQELENALQKAFSNTKQLQIINVVVDSASGKKPQEFEWLTKEEAKPKL